MNHHKNLRLLEGIHKNLSQSLTTFFSNLNHNTLLKIQFFQHVHVTSLPINTHIFIIQYDKVKHKTITSHLNKNISKNLNIAIA